MKRLYITTVLMLVPLSCFATSHGGGITLAGISFGRLGAILSNPIAWMFAH